MRILVYDLDDTLYDTRLLGNKDNIRYDAELYSLMDNQYSNYIYTNAVLKHAVDILERKSLSNLIKGIYYRPEDIRNMKPEVRGYRMVEDGILNEEKLSLFDAPEIYFFDDVSENLRTAKKMGWTTILIDVDKLDASHIDYQYFSVKQALKDMFEKNIL